MCVSHSVMSTSSLPHGLYSSPGSSVHGIIQAKILEWVAIPFSRGSFWPKDRTQVSCVAGRFFTIRATREVPLNRLFFFFFRLPRGAMLCQVLSLVWLFVTPRTVSPPGFLVYEILQARILEWFAVRSSRGSFWPRDQTCVSCGSCMAGGFFTFEPLGKPVFLCLEEEIIIIIIIVIIILATLHACGILVLQAGIEPRPSMES